MYDDQRRPCYMIITELLPKTLPEYLDACELDSDRKTVVIQGIAEGVAYLHSMSIIHRDIKPVNIMVDGEGTPKLIDFGMSKEEEMCASKISTQVAGPQGWMAPEKLRNEGSTIQSDVYSLGLIMYYVEIGSPPALKDREHVRKTLSQNDLTQIMIKECLAEDPTKRPSSHTVALSLTAKRDLVADTRRNSISKRIQTFGEGLGEVIGAVGVAISLPVMLPVVAIGTIGATCSAANCATVDTDEFSSPQRNRAGEEVSRGTCDDEASGGFTGLKAREVFYCGRHKDGSCLCGDCEGHVCGPTEGCPCQDCFALVVSNIVEREYGQQVHKGLGFRVWCMHCCPLERSNRNFFGMLIMPYRSAMKGTLCA